MPTSPFRPSASARARVYETSSEPATAATATTTKIVAAVAREDVRDRGEHEALADAVGGRVEERAEGRRLAAGAGERAVEDVEDRAGDEDGRAEPEEEQLVVALEEDEHRGDEAERDAADRQGVRA